MTSVLPATHLLRAWTVLAVGAIAVVSSVYGVGSMLLPLLVTHRLTVAVFVVAIVAGELLRLPMPSGRAAAPLASAPISTIPPPELGCAHLAVGVREGSAAFL